MKKVIPSGAVLIPDQAEKVFQGEIFSVYQWSQELFDGNYKTFEMLKRADTTAAICIIEDKILILDDEQPNRGVVKSFAGGEIDSQDNDTLAGAKREVLEETGYSFNNWRLVKVTQSYRKIEWFAYVFVAWDTSNKTEPKPDPGEKITTNLMSFTEAKQLITNKVGHLGLANDLFSKVNSTQELTNLPEFSGQTVNR